MAIDPDLEPILQDLTAKLAQLLEGQNTLSARIAVLENAEPPTEEPEEPVDPEEPLENSPEGTAISTDGQKLVFAGKEYMLVPSTWQGLGIAIDGVTLPETNSAQELFIYDGKLWHKAHNRFWQRLIDGWGPELMEDPRKPVDPGVPSGDYPVLPAGMKKPGDYVRSANPLAPQWGTDEIVLTTWKGGAGTLGNPALATFPADGSMVLKARDIGGTWNSGVVQMTKRTPSLGRWGWVSSCEKPDAVCAMFTYENGSGAELDFEYIVRNGVYGWQINVHMPKTTGGSGQVRQPIPLVPMTQAEAKKRHLYEIDFRVDECLFFIDGAQVGRITPAMLENNCTWKTTARFETFCSVEKHGGWAGHEYPAGTEGQMTVWGIKIP